MIYNFLNFEFDSENIKCIYPNKRIAARYEPLSSSGVYDRFYLPTLLQHLDFCMITDVYPVFSLTADPTNPYYPISKTRLEKFADNKEEQDKVLSMMIVHLYMQWLEDPTAGTYALLKDCLRYAQPIMYEKTNSCLPFDSSFLEYMASYIPTTNFSQIKFLNCDIYGAVKCKGMSVMFFEVCSLHHNFSLSSIGEETFYESKPLNRFLVPDGQDFKILTRRMDIVNSEYKPMISQYHPLLYDIYDVFTRPFWKSQFYTSTPFNTKLILPSELTNINYNNKPLLFENPMLKRIFKEHFKTIWGVPHSNITDEFTLYQNNTTTNTNNNDDNYDDDANQGFSSFCYSMLRSKTYKQFPLFMLFIFIKCENNQHHHQQQQHQQQEQKQYFEIIEDAKYKIKSERVLIKYNHLYCMPFGINFKIPGCYRIILNHVVYTNLYTSETKPKVHWWGIKHFQLNPFLDFSFDDIEQVEDYYRKKACPKNTFVKYRVNILTRFCKNKADNSLFLLYLDFFINGDFFYFVMQNNNQLSVCEKVLFLTLIRMYQTFNTRILGGSYKTIIVDTEEYRERRQHMILQREQLTQLQVERQICLPREFLLHPCIYHNFKYQDECGFSEIGTIYCDLSEDTIIKKVKETRRSQFNKKIFPNDIILKYLCLHIDDYSDEEAKVQAEATATAVDHNDSDEDIPNFYTKDPIYDDIDAGTIAAAIDYPDFPVEYLSTGIVKIHRSYAANFVPPVFYFKV